MQEDTLDQRDRAILRELMHDGRLTNAELAERVNLSPSACLRRVRAMEEGGLIAGYLEMGAAGVQLGTRFVCANECVAHPNFKKAFIRASARDAIPSVQIDPRLPVIPVRALKNREMEGFAAKQREVANLLDQGQVEMAEAQLQIEHYWAGALRRAVVAAASARRQQSSVPGRCRRG